MLATGCLYIDAAKVSRPMTCDPKVLRGHGFQYCSGLETACLVVLARLWVHATATTDVTAVTSAISEIIRLQHTPTRAAAIEHSRIFQSLLLGFDSKPEKFCDRFIARLLWLPITALPQYIEFFHDIYSICCSTSDAHSAAFSSTISHHMPFWMNGLVLLRRIARDNATFQPAHHRIAVAIVGHAATCMYNAHDDPISCRDILAQWITADIFGTFEDIITQILNSTELSGMF